MIIVYLCRNVLYADAAYPAYGSGKIFRNHFLGNADGFKDLGSLIGLNGGNPHFGCNLHNSVKNGGIVIVNGGIVILAEQIFLNKLSNGVQCQIGIDRTGTIAQQRGKMMHLSGFARFQNQSQGGLLLCIYQMLMNGGHGQQGGNGHMVLIHTPIRQHENIGPVLIGLVNLHKEPVNGPVKPCALVIGNGNDCNLETVLFHVLDFQHIRIG